MTERTFFARIGVAVAGLTSAKPAAAQFTLRGEQFQARSADVVSKQLRKLGINPALFRDGLKIYYLDKGDYARFCRTTGLAGEIDGFYPLSKGQAVRKVALGELERLPDDSRVMVLPEGTKWQRTVAHEVLHDIYLGGGISRSVRDSFARNLFIWAYKAQTDPRKAEEFKFYRAILDRCNRKFNLHLTGDDIKKIWEGAKLDEATHTYIGECFAYAGELFLGFSKEEELGRLPQEIAFFFENTIRLRA